MIQVSIITNVINLIIVTSFVRVYRVYQIFHNKRLKHLGWRYSNGFLAFLTIVFSLIPIVILVLWFAASGTQNLIVSSQPAINFDGSTRYYLVIEQCFLESKTNLIFALLELMYLYIFLIGNIIFASQTRKSYANFKDTKKVILLMSTMLISTIMFLSFMFTFMLQPTDVDWNSFIVYVYALCDIFACIFIFYVPKLWWIKDLIIK